MELSVIIKYKDGRKIRGVIMNYINELQSIHEFKFVRDYSLKLYRATENKQFITELEPDKIESIDSTIK